MTSHTGHFLAERPRGRPALGAHASSTRRPRLVKKDGDVALEEVGKDAKLPWETDGRRWHSVDRLTTNGTPCRWDGDILAWVDEQIRHAGPFSETNWSERTVVEIAAAEEIAGLVLPRPDRHGMARPPRLPRREEHVQAGRADRQLGLPPLNETPGLEVYGNEPRVKVANRKGPWQEVWMLVHKREEIDTPAFKAFLKQAGGVVPQEPQADDHDAGRRDAVEGQRREVAPGREGLPAGPQDAVGPIDPADVPGDRPRSRRQVSKFQWDARDAITLRIPGVSKGWGRVRTKDNEALDRTISSASRAR